MPYKKVKKNINKDILDSIERHMDDDINLLLENKSVNLGNRELPKLDEFALYDRINASIKVKEKHSWKVVLKWAAVVAVLVVNIVLLSQQFVSETEIVQQKEIVTLKGDRMVVLLADGTRVWLNSDSKLIYPDHFVGNNRKVGLEGEAYFEVKSDEEHPFYVSVGTINVKVTGTSFNVSAYPSDDEIITTLDEGRIRIGTNVDAGNCYMMKPQQTMVYNKLKKAYKITTNEYYHEASDWKLNRLTFRDAPLDEVLKRLSRRFDVSFKILNEKVRKYTYNLSYKGNDIKEVMKIMEGITPIKFIKESEYLYIVK